MKPTKKLITLRLLALSIICSLANSSHAASQATNVRANTTTPVARGYDNAVNANDLQAEQAVRQVRRQHAANTKTIKQNASTMHDNVTEQTNTELTTAKKIKDTKSRASLTKSINRNAQRAHQSIDANQERALKIADQSRARNLEMVHARHDARHAQIRQSHGKAVRTKGPRIDRFHQRTKASTTVVTTPAQPKKDQAAAVSSQTGASSSAQVTSTRVARKTQPATSKRASQRASQRAAQRAKRQSKSRNYNS
jgi:hypothetical protein